MSHIKLDDWYSQTKKEFIIQHAEFLLAMNDYEYKIDLIKDISNDAYIKYWVDITYAYIRTVLINFNLNDK